MTTCRRYSRCLTSHVRSSPPPLFSDSYKQALEAVNIGRAKLAAFGMPIDRPDDYFAEMVKSDEHMKRVCGQHIVEIAVIWLYLTVVFPLLALVLYCRQIGVSRGCIFMA